MAKAKVSITVERSLLERAEQLGRGRSRSEVFETALAEWVASRRTRALDDEIEQYYAGLTEEERAEDEEWAALGDETLRRTR